MFIKSISLTNFRNRGDYSLDFSDTTIFIGPNGVGKTNLVEALWLVATGRSWRTSHDAEMTEWQKEFSRIKLTIKAEEDDKSKLIELFWQMGDKQIKQLKINGVKHRLIDLLGTVPAVLFSPETIDLLNGAPALRRRFLDIILSQTDRRYALNLLEYHKVLRERNKLLAHIKAKRSKQDELEFWDGKLTETGSQIIVRREEVIKFFNKELSRDYEKISGKAQKLNLRYKASVEAERFGDQLSAAREREIEQSTTLYGPHRDDFLFVLEHREVASFASRGEFRSVILALKMAEILYLEHKMGEKPVLLLDDIFSELDASRRQHLAKIVEGQQTIITTTDLDHISKDLQKKAKIIELNP
jgi:DNA replication and repair protein RecF